MKSFNNSRGFKGISINAKIAVLVIFMVASCSISIGIFSFVVHKADSLDYKTETALAVTESVANFIDGDEYSIIIENQEKTDYYYQAQAVIERVRTDTDMRYLYTIAPHGDGENYRYIFDADGEDLFGLLEAIEGYGAEETFAVGKIGGGIYETEEHGVLICSFSPIYNRAGDIVGVVGADLSITDVMREINEFGIKITLVVLLFNAVFLFISYRYLNTVLGEPIKALSDMGKRIAKGDLSTRPFVRNEDEIGILAKNFTSVADTLNELLRDMGDMAEKQRAGDYDAFLDPSKYEGAYCAVADNVNHMVGEYVTEFTEVISVFEAIGSGDFDTSLRMFPGKKASVNTAVENLRLTFKALNKEIYKLLIYASNGDLTRTIDSSKFKGQWGMLIQELNALLKVVLEPIKEAEHVLYKMSEGDFSVRVQGLYKGQFDIIKQSLNSTQNAVSTYIAEISHILHKLSNDDLTVRIDREYIGDFGIIKDSINMIINTFNELVKEMNDSARHVALYSKQVSDTSISLAASALEQSSLIEELNSSVEQVATETAQNLNTANEVSGIMIDAIESAKKGESTMKIMLNAMQEINGSYENITKVLSVISGIASQTNILALNASIEAERAGAAGKGFAVVAQEVGVLAARSQNAARETAKLLDDSIKKVTEGMWAANETYKAFNVISTNVSGASSHIHHIAKSSDIQNDNIIQINHGVSQISKDAQNNSLASQQCADTAQKLSGQADMFKMIVDRFKLDI